MDHESWLVYIWWANILILKMMTFTWCTGRLRVEKKVIHSEADRIFVEEPGVILDPTGGGHPDIDRIRGAHRSDVEIVIPYFLISLIWLETLPSSFLAKLILRTFSLTRIIHGLLYMEIIPAHRYIKILISILSYVIVTYVTISCIAHFS